MGCAARPYSDIETNIAIRSFFKQKLPKVNTKIAQSKVV